MSDQVPDPRIVANMAKAGKTVALMREVRLGLVCYGGVSLAIYMHGVTKELYKLVRAARAFERAYEALAGQVPAGEDPGRWLTGTPDAGYDRRRCCPSWPSRRPACCGTGAPGFSTAT
jgi:hypothetical protein